GGEIRPGIEFGDAEQEAGTAVLVEPQGERDQGGDDDHHVDRREPGRAASPLGGWRTALRPVSGSPGKRLAHGWPLPRPLLTCILEQPVRRPRTPGAARRVRGGGPRSAPADPTRP